MSELSNPPNSGPSSSAGLEALLARDSSAFLDALPDKNKREAYGRVLFALTAWSLAREPLLVFRPKTPDSDEPQATVSFYLRGGEPLFWEIYPRKGRKDAKFSCLSSNHPRVPAALKAELVKKFADMSPGKEVDSESAPTLSFDTLVDVGKCATLMQLLEDALHRVPGE